MEELKAKLKIEAIVRVLELTKEAIKKKDFNRLLELFEIINFMTYFNHEQGMVLFGKLDSVLDEEEKRIFYFYFEKNFEWLENQRNKIENNVTKRKSSFRIYLGKSKKM